MFLPQVCGNSANDFFQIGTSARGSADANLVSQVNRSLSEVGLDARTFSFTSGTTTTGIKNLGSISNLSKDMTGMISTPGVANLMHPSALQGMFAGSAMNLEEHGIKLDKFFNFLDSEGINLKDGVTEKSFNGLLFDASNFDRGALTSSGFSNAITQQIRPLQTSLHEIGHVASRLSGADTGVKESREAFQSVGDRISNMRAGSVGLPQAATEYESSFIKMITQNALEEARAETFSYATLSKTQVGQDFLQNLKSVDFTTDIANGDFLAKHVRGNSFTGTAYYHFNERSNNAFSAYSTMDDNWNSHLRSLGVNVDDLTKRAHIVAAGNIIGAVDFGEYSEAYDPLREGLIKKNREYILNTHGQQYADMYDEAITSGRGQRFGLDIAGDVPPALTGVISSPVVDDLDVSNNVVENKTLNEPPPQKTPRKGPGDLGSPSDVRTRPKPLGTDTAAPQVTPDGTTKPPTSVPTPTTSNTTAATAANNAQAKVTSQAVTQTDDAVDSVSKVKRVSTRGKTLLDNGMDTARKLASGNARAMGIAGAAALLGAGAFAMRRKSEEDIETRLNRQRYGEMR